MSLSSLFNWSRAVTSNELPDIFPFSYLKKDFVSIDVVNIYIRVLTDVLERTEGIPEKQASLLWDNCVASESSDGLVTMLAKAMYEKRELYLVYNKALGLIRKATSAEEIIIKADYAKSGKSTAGIYVTFKNYARSDMLKIYSELEYCTIASLSKNMNLAKAIQLKLKDLRASVGLNDSAEILAQGASIAESLSDGLDIMLDAGDMIVTATPDLTSTDSAMEFINQKRSFYMGLPASWITGVAAKGLGDSGTGDSRAIERGLKNYFFAIVKPVLEAIFGIVVTFKSEDFEQLTTSLEALKTFELTGDELLSQDNKRVIINKLFGLPEDEKGDKPKDIEITPPVVVPPKVVGAPAAV